MSAAYGQRPSSYLGLPPTSWEAYSLDLATLQLGRWIEGKLDERNDKGKPIHKLSDLLSEKPAEQQEFRSMKGLVTKKMAIPENGVW